jgi:hypothetical protein
MATALAVRIRIEFADDQLGLSVLRSYEFKYLYSIDLLFGRLAKLTSSCTFGREGCVDMTFLTTQSLLMSVSGRGFLMAFRIAQQAL